MNIIAKIFLVSYTRTLRKVLIDRNRNRLRPDFGRITKSDVSIIVTDTLKNYQLLFQNVNSGPTYGSFVMVRNGILSQSLYQAIKKFCKDSEYATELCSDVLWISYKKGISLQRFLGRFISRKSQKQMNIIQKIFLSFPLGKPGYYWQINEIDSIASYDILRCPVYDYFKTQNKEDLEFFKNSWCTLDFPLAEHLVKGGLYKRKGTLSEGDNSCGMRWMVP